MGIGTKVLTFYNRLMFKAKLPRITLVPYRASAMVIDKGGEGSVITLAGVRDPKTGEVVALYDRSAIQVLRIIELLSDPNLTDLVDTVMAARGRVHPENIDKVDANGGLKQKTGMFAMSGDPDAEGLTDEKRAKLAAAIEEVLGDQGDPNTSAAVKAARTVH